MNKLSRVGNRVLQSKYSNNNEKNSMNIEIDKFKDQITMIGGGINPIALKRELSNTDSTNHELITAKLDCVEEILETFTTTNKADASNEDIKKIVIDFRDKLSLTETSVLTRPVEETTINRISVSNNQYSNKNKLLGSIKQQLKQYRHVNKSSIDQTSINKILQSMKDTKSIKSFLVQPKQMGGGYDGIEIFKVNITDQDNKSIVFYIKTNIKDAGTKIITNPQEVQELESQYSGLKGGNYLLKNLMAYINQNNKHGIDTTIAQLNINNRQEMLVAIETLKTSHNQAYSYVVLQLQNKLFTLNQDIQNNSFQTSFTHIQSQNSTYQSSALSQQNYNTNYPISSNNQSTYSQSSYNFSVVNTVLTESTNSPNLCNTAQISYQLQHNPKLLSSPYGNWTVGDQLMFNAMYNKNNQLFHLLRNYGIEFQAVKNQDQAILWALEPVWN